LDVKNKSGFGKKYKNKLLIKLLQRTKRVKQTFFCCNYLVILRKFSIFPVVLNGSRVEKQKEIHESKLKKLHGKKV